MVCCILIGFIELFTIQYIYKCGMQNSELKMNVIQLTLLAEQRRVQNVPTEWLLGSSRKTG